MAEKQNQEGEKIYWLTRHVWEAIRNFAGRHKVFFILLLLVILVVGFLTRAFYHDLALGLRKHLGLIVITLAVLTFAWRQIRHRSKWLKYPVIALVFLLFLSAPEWGSGIHNYFSLYYCYRMLNITEINELPETDHERIQPLSSVYSRAMEAITKSENPDLPNFVRIGDRYYWTMIVEPSYTLNRFLNGVSSVFVVPATTPSLDFSGQNRVKVDFPVGPKLLLGRNATFATIKTFGLWRYFNYEPSDVICFTDDQGKLVVAVSLIRWRGIIFPRPEFGGIQLIRQRKESLLSDALLVVFGTGQWIRPDEIKNYPFLQGQNLMSEDVSRFIAGCFRFQNGFLAPMPGLHRDDIRIPDLPDEANQLPYALYFRLKSQGGFDGLYHYFCLEPYDIQKQGLNTSLFVPADGSGKIMVFRHFKRDDGLIGISGVPSKVMASRPIYDWNTSRVIECCPYIKNIGGKIRFFWLAPVVTRKGTRNADTDVTTVIPGTVKGSSTKTVVRPGSLKPTKGRDGNDQFSSAAIPNIVLMDAANMVSVWVDPLQPDKWTEQLQKELSAVWLDNKSNSTPKEGKKDDVRPVLPNLGGDVHRRVPAGTAETHF